MFQASEHQGAKLICSGVKTQRIGPTRRGEPPGDAKVYIDAPPQGIQIAGNGSGHLCVELRGC